MNYEEFKERFAEIIKDPAGQADKATELVADMAVMFEGVESLSKKSEADDERIKELENTNQRLFLSITDSGDSSSEEEDDEEITGVEAIDKFWNELEKED